MFGFPAVLGIERASPVVLAQLFDVTPIAHSSPSILACYRLPANHARNIKVQFYGRVNHNFCLADVSGAFMANSAGVTAPGLGRPGLA
jgi:hypothetical protein